MAPSIKKQNTNRCKTGNCAIKQSSTNGKGDKRRPFSKNKYDKNYESINWKTQ